MCMQRERERERARHATSMRQIRTQKLAHLESSWLPLVLTLISVGFIGLVCMQLVLYVHAARERERERACHATSMRQIRTQKLAHLESSWLPLILTLISLRFIGLSLANKQEKRGPSTLEQCKKYIGYWL
jgi:hypothetical protein